VIRIQDAMRNNQQSFSSYDETNHIPMTYPTALWRNHVQEEICEFIESQNIRLNANSDQFAIALDHLIQSGKVFYEGDINQKSKIGITVSSNKPISFLVALELNDDLANIPLNKGSSIPVICEFLKNPSKLSLESTAQKNLTSIYLRLIRPVFKVNTRLNGNEMRITIEHGLIRSSGLSKNESDLKSSLGLNYTIYENDLMIADHCLALPIVFGLEKAEIVISPNLLFGPYLQGTVTLFDCTA
jgi:hypothetical protein